MGRPKDLSDKPLVKYIPFDNLVGDPYGRPLIGGGVYSSMILLGLIRDAQRAIANAGLSRMDYELDAEQLLALIDRNPDIAGDDEATAQFITDQIQLVRSVLTGLDIDEDYVHLSTVQVNYATNPMQTNMNGVTEVIKSIQREIATGAKSYSVMLNINDSTADTYAIRQMESMVASISAVQEEIAEAFNFYFDVANQVQGIASESRFFFLKQRVLDKLTIAQIKEKHTDTVIKKLDAGLVNPAEARDEIDAFDREFEMSV